MYTQNTPVHVRLWHRGFWALAFANLLLAMSVFMFLPILPYWLGQHFGFSASRVALLFVIHAVGVFLLGPRCSMLVQRYRRNIVCAISIFLTSLASFALYYFCKFNPALLASLDTPTVYLIIAAIQLVGSMFYGLSQMVLSGTLIIDVCESFQRTEANHSAAWFGRLGLALGPIVTILVSPRFGVDTVLLVSSACSLLAMLLVILTDFPFRAPEDNLKAFSTDRFFLTNGIWLFVNFMMIMIAVGIVVVNHQDMRFFVLMLGGFLISLLSQKFVFANAELKSEILSALVLIICALLLMIFRDSDVASLAAALLTGVGVGVSATRFLLFFIKLSPHCKRGTSQSTFFLTWQSGLALGAALGIVTGQSGSGYVVALAFVVAALIMYHFFTHTWYMNNKSR
ncbi:MAG: MFS transporter [Prevotella sp.]|nr:MFS transporter [Prevotella sp.]